MLTINYKIYSLKSKYFTYMKADVIEQCSDPVKSDGTYFIIRHLIRNYGGAF